MVPRSRALVVSIGLNILAISVVMHLLGARPSASLSERPANSAVTSNQPGSVLKAAPGPADPAPFRPFDWTRIESEDYRQYVANLRAIGCPEKTVRDIIRADVRDLFQQKRDRVRGTNSIYNYWRNADESSPLNDDQRAQLESLRLEKREVLRTLLGVEDIEPEDFEAGVLNPMAEMDRRLAFLPEDKREKLKYILAQREDSAARGSSAESEAQTRKAIESLLSSQELLEFDMRESILASMLRGGLQSMEPTEAEFRSIYQCWTTMEAAKALGDSEYQRQRALSENEIRQLVGPARFQLYLEGMKGWQ